MAMSRRITVAGAGILGLWQALMLARRGHAVRLIEKSESPFAESASALAGTMLAPHCEAETAPSDVSDWGRHGLNLWREAYPDIIFRGSLVLAAPRDTPDLEQFAKRTTGHTKVGAEEIGALEPLLAGRFASALFYADEAHLVTPDALAFLLEEAKKVGVQTEVGSAYDRSISTATDDITIDCRGFAARNELSNLRGVRGERLLIKTDEVQLSRPVRFLHPRYPLYIVPWNEGRYLVGATMIESEDDGRITVRSALDLLGALYALHPAFGEAEILETASGIRPAFSDNVPRAIVRDGGRHIHVNGAYRHGFLLAPVLAEAVADHIERAAEHPLLRTEDT